MSSTTIKCSAKDASFANEKIREWLSKTKATKKEIANASLLIEELSICFAQKNETSPMEIKAVNRFGNIGIIIACEQDEFNPLERLTQFDDDEEDFYRRMIIDSNKEKLGYSRKDGKNFVRIDVHSFSANSAVISIFAIVLGVLAGLLMKRFLPLEATAFLNANVLAVIKTIFLNSLKMMIAPVVFFSISTSIMNLSDLGDLGKMGAKLMAIYMSTTVIAIALGLALGFLFSKGNLAFVPPEAAGGLIGKTFNVSVRDIISNIAPKNLVSPIIEGNMLQIIFVSIILGIAANILGVQIKIVSDFMNQMNSLCLKIVVLLVRFIPLAAFCSMASMVLTSGASSLLVIARILIGVVSGGIVMMLIYALLILVFGRLSPLPFLKKTFSFLPTPFSLASSNATMPLTMSFCTEKLGISKRVSSFSIPLGATLNMDGHCVYLALCSILLMKLYGMSVTTSALIAIVISIFVLSVGAPGVPGSGLICLSTVTVTLGLPVECIGLVVGIDQIAGMLRTAFNVSGDIAASAIIAKTHGLLDKNVYAS